MARVSVRSTSKDHLREMIGFIRSRIPPGHRSCWSIARGPAPRRGEPTSYSQWGDAQAPRIFVLWFAKRYELMGFELKMNFG